MKTEYYDCVCSSADHTIRFCYLEDDKDNEIWLEVQLAHNKTWYQRVWKSLKYIFGFECRYGHWDVWLLNPADIDRLISMLEAHRTRLKMTDQSIASQDKSSDVNREKK